VAFAKWKNKNSLPATATLATFATHEQKTEVKNPTVASVATVAVATGENEKVLNRVCDNDLPPLLGIDGGDNSVILANSQNLILVDNLSTVATVAANDYLKLAAQIEPLNKGITE